MDNDWLLKDKKEILCSKPIYRILNFFAADIDDLEKYCYNQTAYQKLAWDKKSSFDVINSFYTVFVCALVIYSGSIQDRKSFWGNLDPITSKWTHAPFGFGKTTALAHATAYGLSDIRKEKYGKKVLSGDNVQHKILCRFLEHSRCTAHLEELASLCHCVANFMPCPAAPYNSAKGGLPQVYDFFPLMVDLIEAHCKTKEPILYHRNGQECQIPAEHLQAWKAWLVDNRERYGLEDYYSIRTGQAGVTYLEGIPFFSAQSLDHPLPQTEEEVEACLKEMLRRIKTRAGRLSASV